MSGLHNVFGHVSFCSAGRAENRLVWRKERICVILSRRVERSSELGGEGNCWRCVSVTVMEQG